MENKKVRRRPVPTQSLDKRGKHKIIDIETELDSQGKPKHIFVYLRKSTKKEGQDDSIPAQNRRVMKYLNSLGITEEDVQKFEDEGISGYKDIVTINSQVTNRPRKGFSQLLKAVDACIEPCTIISYSVSRLGRNIHEGLFLIERLGIGKGQVQKIKEVHICGIKKVVWTKQTRSTDIQEAFTEAQAESEDKKEYMLENLEEYLAKNIYPPMLQTPRGLIATHSGLEETEEMPYIIEAMEMKIKGRSLKQIHQYLKDNGVVYASERTMTQSIFKNTLYVGIYKPGKKSSLPKSIYTELRFTSGKSAITDAFFNELQGKVGKKSGGYGSKQDPNDGVWGLLRYEDDPDAIFVIDRKKGTTQYKGTSKKNPWNKSELKVVSQFIREVIPRIVNLYIGLQRKLVLDTTNEMSKQIDEYDKKNNENIFNQPMTQTVAESIIKDRSQDARWISLQEIIGKLYIKMHLVSRGMESEVSMLEGLTMDEITQLFNDKYGKITVPHDELIIHQSTKLYKDLRKEMDALDKEELVLEGIYSDEWRAIGESEGALRNKIEGELKEAIRSAFNESKILNKDATETKRIQNLIKNLEKKREALKEDFKNVDKKNARLGYKAEVSEEEKADIMDEIKQCEKEITKLSEINNAGDFLDELPSVLIKIFELSSKVLRNEEMSDMRGVLYKLLEITTFELSVDTKKELKIKLHKGVETLENGKFCSGAPDKNRTCV